MIPKRNPFFPMDAKIGKAPMQGALCGLCLREMKQGLHMCSEEALFTATWVHCGTRHFYLVCAGHLMKEE